MKLKRLLLVVGGMLVLAVCLCVGGSLASNIVGSSAATPGASATPAPIAVRARGEVVPVRWADLAFDSPGTLAEWFAKEGQTVKAGDPIGRLDTADLDRAAAQAELRLRQAQLKLEQLEQPADGAEVRQAQHAVDQAANAVGVARINYNAVLSSTLQTSALEDARKAFEEAKHRYEARLAEYERGEAAYWFVEQARKAHDEEQLALARLQQQADAQAASARGELARAGQNHREALDRLERLLAGADPLALKAAQLDVESAQMALDEARRALEGATLIAPFDGTLVTLHVQPLNRIGAGAPAATLADLSALRIETTDLDEWGAAKIHAGSTATIVFNAFDDKSLTGHVTEIGLRGRQSPAGDVVYQAVIELDAPDPALRWGMSVRITLPIE